MGERALALVLHYYCSVAQVALVLGVNDNLLRASAGHQLKRNHDRMLQVADGCTNEMQDAVRCLASSIQLLKMEVLHLPEKKPKKDEYDRRPNFVSRHLTAILIAHLNAKNTINVCIYQLTQYDLAKALIYAHKKCDIDVRVIVNFACMSKPGSEIQDLVKAGIEVFYHRKGKNFINHPRYCTVEGHVLIAGSLNWL